MNAGKIEEDARPDPIMICPVWICMPQARVVMQTLQLTNDLEDDDVANDDDLQKVKSALADVICQIPKSIFVAR